MPFTKLFTTHTVGWRRSSLPDARELFEQYAEAYARGERPRARDYLDRADDGEGDALSLMIERFLESAPVRPARAEDEALVAALAAGEPPLLELRLRARLRVDEVVDVLVAALAIDAGKRGKVKGYYQRLEGGILDAAGVAAAVWDALATILPGAADVAAMRPRAVAAESGYFRVAEGIAQAPSMADREPGERDEVDDLFTGARGGR